MKKLIILLCVVAMSFSLTACGGSSPEPAVPAAAVSAAPAAPAPTASETSKAPEPSKTPEPSKAPEPTAAPKEPEISAYDKAKQAILDHVDVAYTGLTSAGAPMYFLASSDGEYVALVLENSDKKRYIKFIGSAVIDDDSGILTVTDDEKGYTFGFTAEKQEDGSFFLDCGNLGECYLEPDEPGDVVDYIVMTFGSMEDTTDELIETMTTEGILDYIDVAYSGITAAGGSMYYLANYDGSFAALILENADETSYIKFVGTTTIDEDGIQTVTDSEKGYRFGFSAEAEEDGSYFLDCGDLGECYLEPDEPENVMDYLSITFEDMEDVTDEFMDAYGH